MTGRVERLLRGTKVTRPRSVEKAYRDPEAGRLLIGARRSLKLRLYDTDLYLRDIFSEAIEAASTLKI